MLSSSVFYPSARCKTAFYPSVSGSAAKIVAVPMIRARWVVFFPVPRSIFPSKLELTIDSYSIPIVSFAGAVIDLISFRDI